MSKTIKATLNGNRIPEVRISGNNAQWVVKSTPNGFRLKVSESTMDCKYQDFKMNIKIKYDLGLLTRYLRPVIYPMLGLAKRIALKLIDRVSLEITQESSEAKLEGCRKDKSLVASYGRSTSRFRISGREVLDTINRIKAGDCSIPELDYHLNLDGVSVCSEHGDKMFHDVELRNGRMMSIGSALVEGKFYHNTIVDLWDESTIPDWLRDVAMDLLEVSSDFYCK